MKSYSNISLVENHTIIKKILVSCLLSFVLCSKTIAMSFPDNQKNKKAPCQTFLWVQLGTAWRREWDHSQQLLTLHGLYSLFLLLSTLWLLCGSSGLLCKLAHPFKLRPPGRKGACLNNIFYFSSFYFFKIYM